MLLRRITCVLAVGLLLAVIVGGARETRHAATAGPPVAAIDLGGIFGGDEDEADEDENEPEEDAGPQRERREGSGISIFSLLLGAGAGVLGSGLVLRQLRRRAG